MNKQPKLLTPAQVADLFLVDPKTVNRWVKAGKIASIRTPGGQNRFDYAEVMAIVQPLKPGDVIPPERNGGGIGYVPVTPFEAATHELLGVIGEALGPVRGHDDDTRRRLAVVRVRVQNLVACLVIDQGYPDLPDFPAKDVRKASAAIRRTLAELRQEAAA